MTRRRKWLLTGSGLALALVLGALIGPPGEALLRRAVERRLERTLGGRVRLAKLDLHPLAGSVEIEGLTLSEGKGSLARLALDRASLSPAWLDLLVGRLRPTSLAADGLQLEWVASGGPPPEEVFFDLGVFSRLRRVRVSRGVILAGGERWPFDLDARGLRLRLDGEEGEVEGTGSAGPLRFTIKGRPPLEFDHLSARLVWRNGRLQIPRLRVDGPAGSATTSVSLRFDGRRVRFSGGARGRTPLSAWLGDQLEGEGEIQAFLSFSGQWPGAWRLDGRFSSEGPVRTAGVEWKRIGGEIAVEPGMLRFEGVGGETLGGSRLEELTAARSEEGWRVRGRLSARLEEWLERFGLDPRLAPGKGEFEIRAELPAAGSAARWTISGGVEGERPGVESLAGEVEISGDGRGGRASYGGRWFGSRVDGQLRWTGERPLAEWNAEFLLEAPEAGAAERAIGKLIGQWERLGRDWPERLTPRPGAGLRAEGRVAGAGKRVDRIDVAGSLERPIFSRAHFDRLELRVLQRGEHEALSLEGRLALADGRGTLFEADRAPSGPWRLAADWRDAPLALLTHLVEQPQVLEWGNGSLDGRLRGTWDEGGPHLGFTTSLEGWSALGTVLSAETEGSFGGGELDLRKGRIEWGGILGKFSGTAWIDEAGGMPPVEAEIDLRADLGRLPAILGLPASRGVLRGRGSVEFAGLDRPLRCDGWVGWGEAVIAGIPVPQGESRIEAQPGGTRFSAEIGGTTLAGELTGPARAPRMSGRLAWRDLELIQLVEAYLDRPVGLSLGAWTDGNFDLAGELLDPGTWAGQGRLESLDILGPSFSSSLEEAGALALSPGGRLAIPEGAPLRMQGTPSGRFALAGGAELWGARAGTLELSFAGDTDLSVLEAFDPDLVISGRLAGSGVVSGTISGPAFDGRLHVEKARVRMLSSGVTVEDIETDLLLDGHRLSFEDARGRLGGGEIRLDGGLTLDAWLPERLDLALSAEDVALSFPKGMWGRYDAGLTLEGRMDALVLAGRAVLLAGRYTKEFDFLEPFAGRRRLVEPSTPFTSWLAQVGLDVQLSAKESMTIRNQMALLSADLRLQVEGTLAAPQLAGQLSLLDGGRLSFRDVDYDIVSGQLVLDDTGSEPLRLQVRARTLVRGYRVFLDLDATPESLDYHLSSTPALPSRDILMLLLTGQDPSEGGIGGNSVNSADLATAYFGTKLGELLLAGPARRWLGITHFTISPSQFSSEAAPTARVTVGRRIDERTYVLYSRDLSPRGRDVYRLEKDLGPFLRLVAGQDVLGGVGLDLSWLARFDSNRHMVRAQGSHGAQGRWSLKITGLPAGFPSMSARRIGLSGRQSLTRAMVLEARETLRGLLVGAGYLEARVSALRSPPPAGRGAAVLDLAVDAGPRWTIGVKGPARMGRRVREELVKLWTDTEFRPSALREAARVLRDWFADQGRAVAVVSMKTDPQSPHTLVVEVDPGPKVSVAKLTVTGTSAIPKEKVLAQILSRPGGGLGAGRRRLYRPRLVAEDQAAIASLYHQRGYLGARVEVRTAYYSSGDAVDLVFRVREGGPFPIRRLQVVGDWPEDLGSATERLASKQGSVFLPEKVNKDQQTLRKTLDEAGYYEAKVLTRPVVGDKQVDLVFRVRAGPKARVAGVRYVGLRRTSEKLVRKRVDFKQGEPLSAVKMRRIEGALFRTGLFRDVELTHEPEGRDPGRQVVVVSFREAPALGLRASVGYDSEERLRTSVTVSHDNVGGKGRRASFQAFLSGLRRGARVTVEQPRVVRDDLEGLMTFNVQREEREGFDVATTGLAVQIGTKPLGRRRWQWIYSLTADRFSNVTLDPDALEEVLRAERGRLEPVRLGSLSLSWISDRRNDPFLPRSGSVARAELGVFARVLGSEAEFLRWQGEYVVYRPWGPKTVVVGALRAGMEWPFGGTVAVPLSKRLFVGGSSSVRGFSRDRVGPLDGPGGDPLGGESSLVFNLELRRKIWKDLSLVLFSDSGNAWLETSDLSLGDLRSSVGLGVRFGTPVGALRLEYGYKLDRRDGESPGRVLLSIGEAF